MFEKNKDLKIWPEFIFLEKRDMVSPGFIIPEVVKGEWISRGFELACAISFFSPDCSLPKPTVRH